MFQFLRRYLPDPDKLRQHKSLRLLGDRLHDPWLWNFNRRSVVRGLGIGAFFAFVPLPWQMLLVVFTALWLRFNLPIAVAMVWITNPITLPPIAFVSYRLGVWLLQKPAGNWTFEPSLDWLLERASDIGLPLVVGSMATAVVAGIATFAMAHLLWRWRIINRFRRRRVLASVG